MQMDKIGPLPSAQSARRRLAVIGNGPSLKGFDFRRFEGVSTLGMNAAYRYWREIDWRPTHYACLDDALIDTHLEAIVELLNEGRIESFFLSGRALELRPDLADDQRVRFLDEFVPHWHRVRGTTFGLQLTDEPAFRTAFPNLLTTGAYAVRYAIMLGYPEIGLFGVDLVYSDIPSAENAGGNRLVMTETPDSNPNYFFDGYQRQGDVFHVPNPESHDGELHLESFRAMRDDFLANQIRGRIVNTSPRSRLARDAVLPFEPAAAFLDESSLSSVIVPVTAGETAQLVANLKHFATPAGAPWLGAKPKQLPLLLIVFNNDAAASAQSAIHSAYNRLNETCEAFSGVEFLNLGLSGDSDLYERSNQAKGGKEGLRAGPNNLFFGSMAAVADRPGHALFMETDCIAIRPGWLEAASRTIAYNRQSWVIGSIYRGRDALGPKEKRHINGNALYAAGDESFQDFLNKTWRPHLEGVRSERPEMPFDCVVEDLFQRADARNTIDDDYWPVVQAIAHRMVYSGFIINIAGEALEPALFAEFVESLVAGTLDCHLIHSRQLAEAYLQAAENEQSSELTAIIGRLRGEEGRASRRSATVSQSDSVQLAKQKIRSGLKAIARKMRNP